MKRTALVIFTMRLQTLEILYIFERVLRCSQSREKMKNFLCVLFFSETWAARSTVLWSSIKGKYNSNSEVTVPSGEEWILDENMNVGTLTIKVKDKKKSYHNFKKGWILMAYRETKYRIARFLHSCRPRRFFQSRKRERAYGTRRDNLHQDSFKLGSSEI